MLIINMSLHHVALIPLHLVLDYHLLLIVHTLTEVRKLHLVGLRFDLVLLLALRSYVVLSIDIGREIALSNHILLGHSSKSLRIHRVCARSLPLLEFLLADVHLLLSQ